MRQGVLLSVLLVVGLTESIWPSNCLAFAATTTGLHETEDPEHEHYQYNTAAGYGYYPPDLHSVLRTMTGEFGLKLDNASINEAVNMTDLLYRFDLYEAPYTLSHEHYDSIPIFIAPICIAYNLQVFRKVSLTLEHLSALLFDPSTPFVFSDTDNEVNPLYSDHITVVVGPEGDSIANEIVMRTLARLANLSATVSGWSELVDFPPEVFTHTNLKSLASDREIAATVKATPDSIGFVSPTAAASNRLPCLPIRMTHELTTYRLLPHLHEEDNPYYDVVEHNETRFEEHIVDGQTVLVELIPSFDVQLKDEKVLYPLVGPILLTVNKTRTCTSDLSSQEILDIYRHFLTDEDLHTLMLQWGFVPVHPKTAVSGFLQMHHAICVRGEFRDVEVSGALASVAAIQAMSIKYLEEKPMFFAYTGVNSQYGLDTLADGASGVVAASGIPVSAATYPELRQIPLLSFPISIVFNLAGLVDELHLPACTLLPIFRGQIEYWDDTEIQEANPTAVLPHTPICLVTRSGSTSLHTAITAGLMALTEQYCVQYLNATHPAHTYNLSGLVSSSEWATNGFKSTLTVATADGILHEVHERDFCLGYAPAPEAEIHGLNAASIEFEVTGILAKPLARFVSSKLSKATRIDGHSMIYELPFDARTYPFIGTTYWTYNEHYHTNCTEVKDALTFIKWSLEDPTARSSIEAQGFVPWPHEINDEASAALNVIKCAGEFIFPPPPTPFPYWVLAPIIAVILLMAFALYRYYTVYYVLHAAPKHSHKPFTVMFVGPRNTADLAHKFSPEVVELLMARLMVRTIDDVCWKTDCYRVKRVGEFCMIAARNPRNALRCAVEIEKKMQQWDWERTLRETTEESESHSPMPIDSRSSRISSKSSSKGSSKSSKYRTSSPALPISPHAQPGRRHRPRGGIESAEYSTASSSPYGSPQSRRVTLTTEPQSTTRSTHSSSSMGRLSELQLCYGIHHGKGRVSYDKHGHRYDYFGDVVDTAAFVADRCKPHQILLSAEAEVALAKDVRGEGGKLAEGEIVPYASVEKDGHEMELRQFNGKDLLVRIFEPPEEGSENTLLSALEEAKCGVTKKRVGVLVVHLTEFVHLMKDLPREDAPKRHVAVYSLVEAIATKNRGHIFSFADACFTLTFNVVSPCGSHVIRAGTCALEIVDALQEQFRLEHVTCGIASGSCLVGTQTQVTQKKKEELQVLLGTLTTQAMLLAQLCREYKGAYVLAPSTISVHELSSGFLFNSIDIVYPRHPDRQLLSPIPTPRVSAPEAGSTEDKKKSWPTMFVLQAILCPRPTSEEGEEMEWLYEFGQKGDDDEGAGDIRTVSNEIYSLLLKGDIVSCHQKYKKLMDEWTVVEDSGENLGLKQLQNIHFYKTEPHEEEVGFFHVQEYAVERFRHLLSVVHASPF